MRNFVLGLASLLLLTAASTAPVPQIYVVNTFAGGGPNGVPASGAAIGDVLGVATDPAGNVFISGYTQGQLFRVAAGQIYVDAGNGVQAYGQPYSGDGGPASQAFIRPGSVAKDSLGDLIIPDPALGYLHKVDQNGILTTIAGNGKMGGGTPGSPQCVFDGDGPARQHTLCQPSQVTLDSHGNVYIAESLSNRIRKLDAQGNLTTVAGNGALNVYSQCVFDGDGPATSHALCRPFGLVLDAADNLYVADSLNHRVRKVDSSGNMTTIVGNGTMGFSGDGGQALLASLDDPIGLVFDSSGSLLIGDSGNSRVRKVDTNGIISTIAGNGNCPFDGEGPALSHSICFAGYLAIDSAANLYIVDANRRVRRLDSSGMLTTVAGNGSIGYGGDGGQANQAALYNPVVVTADPSGNVYFGDSSNGTLRKVDTHGVISTVGGGTNGEFLLADGQGNLFFTSGNTVARTDLQANTVVVAGNGSCPFDGDGPATAHSVCNPQSIALDNLGNLFIGDSGNYRIRKVDTSGNMTTIAGSGGNLPLVCSDGDGPALQHLLCVGNGLAVDQSGNVFFSDAAGFLREVGNGTLTTIAGSGMTGPNGCVFDGDGPALQHSLCYPTGVVADAAGTVYVMSNQRIRAVSGGSMTTVAGSSDSMGFGGDGGAATSALFANPTSIAIDGNGTIYVADAYNARIRSLTVNSGFAFVAPQKSATVSAGGTATYDIQLIPASGFSGTVSLTCTGVPATVSCIASPSSVNLSGAAPMNATFTLRTDVSAGMIPGPATGTTGWLALLGILSFLGFTLTADTWNRRKIRLGFVAVLVGLLASCGGGSSGTGGGVGGGSHTSPGTYTVILSAASGSLTHSTSVTLKIQ